MDINLSGAAFSSIVGIGARVKSLSEQTGEEYLFLNRGVNAVTNIRLDEIIKKIDFNSAAIQMYPPNKGLPELRKAINDDYFNGAVDVEHIQIVPGGMPALDLVLQTMKADKLYHGKYFWGSYGKVARIRNVPVSTYETLHELNQSLRQSPERAAVLICDPNNPIGNKIDDNYLYEQIRALSDSGAVVIFDSPYRRIFVQDDFFYRLSRLENVIVTESFSKSVGLSGQRLGFIYSGVKKFNEELNIRLLYSFNGVNAFAQQLVYLLLATPEGKTAVQEFRDATAADIARNIRFLSDNDLLYRPFYRNSMPQGIFSVINVSEEELLRHRIGSVSMVYFSNEKTELERSLSRICVSVPHQKLVRYFSPVLDSRKNRLVAASGYPGIENIVVSFMSV